MTEVSIVDIKDDLLGAVRGAMDAHGMAGTIAEKPDVYVKVNAIDSKPYTYTDTAVTGEVLAYCREAGAKNLFLMENATQGNFTRLVFYAAGFEKVARENGARPLYLDYKGKGGFTIVMGKGQDTEKIDAIEGRVFVAGPCAYDEVGARLIERLGEKNVFFTRECNDLAGNLGALNKLMGVSPFKMVPINPVRSLVLLLQARLHRTTARIPPLFP